MLFGIMLGRAPGSIPIIILAANWLLEANFRQKIQQLKSNTLVWILISPFVLLLIGLLYTNDFNWAFNIIRVSLPLLILPIVLLTSKPLSEKEFHAALVSFLMGCFINITWCLVYSFILHQNDEFRDASRFMNHIRLGLFINLAIATCVYLALKSKSGFYKVGLFCLAFYFVSTLFILGLASGLINLFLILICALFYILYKQNKTIKVLVLILLVVSITTLSNYINTIKNKQLKVINKEYNQIYSTNKLGQQHIHFKHHGQKENGNYIYINIQIDGLKNAWNKRVPADTFSFERRDNLGRYNMLLRYLSSKSLTKDEAGIHALTNEDIDNILNNAPNYEYPNWNYLHKRIYEFVNEYDDFMNHRDVNGHSLAMRFYYWRATLKVIQNHLLLGVGTGDLQQELNKIYERDFPELKKEWYKHTHNQFLNFTATYGIIGLFILLVVLIYPILKLRPYFSPLYAVFYLLLVASFFTEDTLESQAGMGFYAIFNSLFCSMAWQNKENN
jgi:O-antigen ligase